jgi:hypothetical protein
MNKNLAAFSGILLLLSFILGFAAMQLSKPSFFVLILTVLTGSTWLVYFFMHKAKREDFIKNYLLTIVLKLLGGGIFILVLLRFDRAGAGANALLFMAAYFLFTGLEVGFLFKRLK